MDSSAASRPLPHRVWPGPSPVAPTVLLLNTAFGRIAELHSLAAAVSPRATVVGVEFREDDELHVRAARSVQEDAGRAARLLGRLSPRRLHVVGLCYGSLVALELALRFPGAALRVALCEPLVVPAPGFIAGMERFLLASGGAAAREQAVAGLYDAFFGEEFRHRNALAHRLNAVLFASEWKREGSFAALRATIGAQYRYVLGVASRVEALGAAARSAWLVVGERDALVPAADVQALASRIGARCRIVPSSGHAIHLEQPEPLSSFVLDWLSEDVEEAP